MKPGLDENEPADEHVEVDVLVEGELVREAHLAEEGDAVAEDEEDADHRVHHQPSTHRTGNHVEWVWCHSVEHGEVLEVVSSLDHDGNVEANDEVEEGKKGEVVPPVAEGEVVGQLFPGWWAVSVSSPLQMSSTKLPFQSLLWVHHYEIFQT